MQHVGQWGSRKRRGKRGAGSGSGVDGKGRGQRLVHQEWVEGKEDWGKPWGNGRKLGVGEGDGVGERGSSVGKGGIPQGQE